MIGFNFGYLHQVYASSPSLAALARVVCSPSPLPRFTRQRGCSRYSPAPPTTELRGRGLYSAVGLRPRLRVRPPTYKPSMRRRPLACDPSGAVPSHGLALLIGIEVLLPKWQESPLTARRQRRTMTFRIKEFRSSVDLVPPAVAVLEVIGIRSAELPCSCKRCSGCSTTNRTFQRRPGTDRVCH